MTTLIDLVTEAFDDIGSLVVPASLFGNDDDLAKQVIAIAKKIGREMTGDHDWQSRLKIATVTTVAGTDNYALEADCDRIVSETAWDANTRRKLDGNTSSRQWSAITNARLQVSVTHWWRLRGNRIYVTPTPDSAWSFNYEYRSKYYCSTNGGTEQAKWLADNDIWLLDDVLFLGGLNYYVRKQNNLPYADAEQEYNDIILRQETTDIPSAMVDLSARVPQRKYTIPTLNIPDHAGD